MINSTTASEQIQFGLCDPPEPIYLYVGQTEANGETALWYQFDIDAQKQLPVLLRGLTGYISELRITVKEFKGKENSKLDIVVHADQLYIIRSGIETNFSKTLLLALSCVTNFKQPLTIAVASGEENVVFARLYDAITKARFKADWKLDTDWLTLISQLQVGLGQSPRESQRREGQPLTQITHETQQITRNTAAARLSQRIKGQPSTQITHETQQTTQNTAAPLSLSPIATPLVESPIVTPSAQELSPAASNNQHQVTHQAIASLGVAHAHKDESASLQAPAATEAIPLQKPLPSLSNSERVKAVRNLTGHSTDAVIAQLQAHYGTNHPKHLSSDQCDLLIQALVSDWYQTLHLPEPFPIIPYREHLQELRQQGLSEADALQALMSQLKNRNVHSQV